MRSWETGCPLPLSTPIDNPESPFGVLNSLGRSHHPSWSRQLSCLPRRRSAIFDVNIAARLVGQSRGAAYSAEVGYA